MAAENATVNLYINNEQAIAAVDSLRLEYLRLKDARKEALNTKDYQKASDLDAQMIVAKRKLTNATKGQLDVEKALANINKINIDQLYQVRKSLTAEVRTLNRDTEEYIKKRQQLVTVENEIKKASSSANAEQKKGMSFLSKIVPTIDIGSMFMQGVSMAKEFIGEIWSVSQRLQGDAKKAATVFGDELGYVEYQATQLSKAMGLTDAEFVSLTANTADLLVPLGYTRKEAASMAVQLQSLTGALDEWTTGRYGAEDISSRLTKAVLGETESLKDLGISIRMDSDEYKNLVKQKLEDEKMTEAQARAMATLDLIYAKTQDAQTAYASKGNDLLRFQKSASRGWRDMIEAVGDWFAFSVDERLAKEVRQFQAMSEEVDKTESALGTLMPRYEELTTKADLNAIEQEELRSVIDKIASIVPNAVSGFDEYGRALGINTGVVEQFTESARLMRLEMERETIADVADRLRDQMMEVSKANTNLSFAKGAQRSVDDLRGLDPQMTIGNSVLTRTTAGARVAEVDGQVSAAEQRLLDARKSASESAELLSAFGMSAGQIAEAVNDAFSWASVADLTADDVESMLKLSSGSDDADADTDAEEEAKRKAEEEAKRKAEEEAKRKEAALKAQQERNAALAKAAEDAHKKELAAEEKRQGELAKIVLGGKDFYTQAKAQYDAKLDALGLANKKEEDMTVTEKEALLQLEREFGNKLATQRLAEANSVMADKTKALEAELSATKIAQAEELESATTLADMRAILSRTHSDEELAEITTTAQARNEILKQYEAERAEQAQAQLLETLELYQKMYSELSEQGTMFGIAYDIDPAQMEALAERITVLQEKLAELKLMTTGGEDDPKGKKGSKVDVMGMSSDDWEDLFTNFDKAADKMKLIEGAVNVISDAWGGVNDLVSAAAERELADYEKKQDAKKDSLQRRLDQGLISEAYYNEQISAIEEQTNAKSEEIAREAAERERALAVFNATVSTAVSVVKALEAGPIAGPILAGIIGAMGAVQIATILAAPLPGAESGGFIDVVRSQDNKPFNARLSPGTRGYVDSPTVIIGESGDEFVANNAAVNNPTIRPVLDLIDQAQRDGTVGSINLNRELASPTAVMLSGRVDGGYIGGSASAQAPSPVASDVKTNTELLKAIKLLIIKLGLPIKAYVTMTGDDGLVAQQKKYDNYKSNSKL